MRVLVTLVRKDLLRRLRSPLGISVALSFPIVFSLMLAVVFGSGGNEAIRIHILVENRDDEYIGGMLMSALTSDEVSEHFDVEVVGEEGARMMEEGKASALLNKPERFSQDLLEGTPASLSLIRNPAQGIKPEIAEQLTGILVQILDSGARVLREPLNDIATWTKDDSPMLTDERLISIVLEMRRTIDGAGDFIFPPAIIMESTALGSEEEDDEDNGSNPGVALIFMFVLPGISVYALFLVGDLAMRDIPAELYAGTLRRQLAGPIGAGTIVLAKALYTACLSLIALVILSTIGWFLIKTPVSLAGFVVLSLALVMAITGLAATLYGASGGERRGSTIGGVLYLVLAFAGGSFMPLDNLPATVRAVSPISPFYWGTSGYRALLEDGAGLTDILQNAGVLAAIGVTACALGAFLLSRFVRAGRTVE